MMRDSDNAAHTLMQAPDFNTQSYSPRLPDQADYVQPGRPSSESKHQNLQMRDVSSPLPLDM